VWEETAVVFECIKAADDFSIDAIPGETVGDYFLGLGDDFQNCFAQFFKR
jgi:hypothetical protein